MNSFNQTFTWFQATFLIAAVNGEFFQPGVKLGVGAPRPIANVCLGAAQSTKRFCNNDDSCVANGFFVSLNF